MEKDMLKTFTYCLLHLEKSQKLIPKTFELVNSSFGS